MLIEKLQQLRRTHISLALVGLMWVFPFLHYHHKLPLTSFDQEWWGALLGVIAVAMMAGRSYWGQSGVPRVIQLPLAMIVVVMLQWIAGKIVYFDHALLIVLYMSLVALLMLLGARLREVFGMNQMAYMLAMFLLFGSEVNAVIALLQHYHVHTVLDAVIINKVYAGVFGNIGQSNHFANYVALGLISLGLLLKQGRLSMKTVVLLALPLLYVMLLSGSRSAWLYLFMMAGLAGWFAKGNVKNRPLIYYSVALIAGFGLMHLLLQAVHVMIQHGATASIVEGYQPVERLTNVSKSGSQRLYLWQEALMMFRHSPILGVGFGQFAWHHFQLLPLLRPEYVVGAYNNAHNVIFHLAAETGLLGLAAFLIPLGIWVAGVSKTPSATEGYWWAYAILGVMAIHSLLEYPLWYVYFIAIAAILLGALDETRFSIRFRKTGQLAMYAVLFLGAVMLVQMYSGYRKLEQTLSIMPESRGDKVAFARIRTGLIEVMSFPLLAPYAEVPLSGQMQVNSEYIKEKLAINTRVLRAQPKGYLAYRQAMLLAQDDQQEQARGMMVHAIWSFPQSFVDARWQLTELAAKDPAHYAALLKFAIEKEQEYRSGIRRN